MSIDSKEVDQIVRESQSTYNDLNEEEKKEIQEILHRHIRNRKLETDENSSEVLGEAAQSMPSLVSLWGLMIVTTLVMLTAYHYKFKQSSMIGTVDIAAVVKIKEQQFTDLLSRSNTTDADRQAAYSLVSNIGSDIERALDIVQKKCGCTLVVKNAVLAGSADDYTDMLKEQLGMVKGGN